MTAEQHRFPAWPDAEQSAGTPSGLFPSGVPAGPSRPTYREPHPVRGAAFAVGAGVAAAWFLLFGLLGGDLRGRAWWTLLAGVVAWFAALALVRFGDRAAATGVALVTALAWSFAVIAVGVRWSTVGWLLW